MEFIYVGNLINSSSLNRGEFAFWLDVRHLLVVLLAIVRGLLLQLGRGFTINKLKR